VTFSGTVQPPAAVMYERGKVITDAPWSIATDFTSVKAGELESVRFVDDAAPDLRL
jgi:hypothetical protein